MAGKNKKKKTWKEKGLKPYLLALPEATMNRWKQRAKDMNVSFVDFLKLAVESLDKSPDLTETKVVIWNEDEERTMKMVERKMQESQRLESLTERFDRLSVSQKKQIHELLMRKNYSLDRALRRVEKVRT